MLEIFVLKNQKKRAMRVELITTTLEGWGSPN